ncbi:MAG: acylphosphatase [Patulibacter minatonensis]
MADSDQVALRAIVRGTVQGVGLRAATVERARSLGLFGWARNEDDGSVQVHAEGPAAAVEELREFLDEGPPAARVDEVEQLPVKVEGHEQFAVRGVPAGRFVVEPTGGERPGVALWLEVGDGWRRWNLSKAPSMVPADKRFASLAGESEAAPDPGAGDTILDAGLYEQGGRVAWPEAIERGHAVFVLHGDQLRGGFALQRTRGNSWLLIKRRDEFAAT